MLNYAFGYCHRREVSFTRFDHARDIGRVSWTREAGRVIVHIHHQDGQIDGGGTWLRWTRIPGH